MHRREMSAFLQSRVVRTRNLWLSSNAPRNTTRVRYYVNAHGTDDNVEKRHERTITRGGNNVSFSANSKTNTGSRIRFQGSVDEWSRGVILISVDGLGNMSASSSSSSRLFDPLGRQVRPEMYSILRLDADIRPVQQAPCRFLTAKLKT